MENLVLNVDNFYKLTVRQQTLISFFIYLQEIFSSI